MVRMVLNPFILSADRCMLSWRMSWNGLVQLTTILFLPTCFNENSGRVSCADRVLPANKISRCKKNTGSLFSYCINGIAAVFFYPQKTKIGSSPRFSKILTIRSVKIGFPVNLRYESAGFYCPAESSFSRPGHMLQNRVCQYKQYRWGYPFAGKVHS